VRNDTAHGTLGTDVNRNIKKIKLVLSLALFPLRGLLQKVGIDYDIVKITNEYYRDDFARIQPEQIAVILPHCLVNARCASRFSKENGIICTECGRCGCGEIKTLCEEKKLQFFISPSMGFTKRLAQRTNMRGAIGAVCDYELQRGLRNETITPKGVNLRDRKVIPQTIIIAKYDCLNNEMDWERLKQFIGKIQ